ncbi:glucose-1-phosphate adenylyltransferase [Gehongia tenuis]|uniref:Glucose-1-phosphate adenylyltransferase n=1 Tax=Gehongia tenuis TaxID=2763655 RepID=A0A926D348_9FIRM|nr:glucose-1-phosphate adenylyltransferase [Gehongia tenuis]MBC8530366.1 glucose-1-phosphate adenylyltransferase [Gehongia tenuis]
MEHKSCIAMLLAGGQGSRLGILTRDIAKPAVYFGGKYRIIDFPLSNCTNSGLDTVGVLTQYKPLALNSYIASGQPWDLDRTNGGVFVLPPYMSGNTGQWYKGTANAIYQNISFIEQFEPDNVLILSGDHIYKMDYSEMLAFHVRRKADATIAVFEVPWEEAPRFGIMNTDEKGAIVEFEEKPKVPKSNKASMGVYIFRWPTLKRLLMEDEKNEASSNDFGKNIIPAMLAAGSSVCAYPFKGYWKDVGTVDSLWEANMDLLNDPPLLDLYDPDWRIYSRNPGQPPHYIAPEGRAVRSMVTEGCMIYGLIEHSVLFNGVTVEAGAEIHDSVILPGAVVRKGARVYRAIVGEDTVIGEDAVIGEPGAAKTAVIGDGCCLPAGMKVASDAVISHTDTMDTATA